MASEFSCPFLSVLSLDGVHKEVVLIVDEKRGLILDTFATDLAPLGRFFELPLLAQFIPLGSFSRALLRTFPLWRGIPNLIFSLLLKIVIRLV